MRHLAFLANAGSTPAPQLVRAYFQHFSASSLQPQASFVLNSGRASPDCLVNAVDHVLDVTLVESCQRDPAGLQEVDVVLLDEAIALWDGQACEGEHADLVGDVVPGAGCALRLQTFPQNITDPEDAVCHGLQFGLPGLEALRAAQNLHDELSSPLWRAGVHWSNDHLQLREHALCLLRIVADHVQHANAFTVEAQVLRKGLAHEELKPKRLKEADSIGVLDQAAGSIALVGAVHEREQTLPLHQLRNLVPLLICRINASRVVGAGVEKHNGAVRSTLQSGHHGREVQRL
mmetsp:Transcript_27318/g.43790  ORF Transcript_27318/g.43790 Transcript_27318/m.43790 type:complete len:290 (+) Transcript_27318:45-914(+)